MTQEVIMHHQFTTKDIDRFWSKVNKSGDCWLWTGALNGAHCGYGQFSFTPKSSPRVLLLAHRVSYELAHGPVPDDISVCHSCDINYPLGDITYRRCVNPDHLWLGTNQQNAQDCSEKHRRRKPKNRPTRGYRFGSRKIKP